MVAKKEKAFEEFDEKTLELSTKIMMEHFDRQLIEDGIFINLMTVHGPVEHLHQNMANIIDPYPFELRYMMFLKQTKYASPKHECHCESCEGGCAGERPAESDEELDKIRKAKMDKLMGKNA